MRKKGKVRTLSFKKNYSANPCAIIVGTGVKAYCPFEEIRLIVKMLIGPLSKFWIWNENDGYFVKVVNLRMKCTSLQPGSSDATPCSNSVCALDWTYLSSQEVSHSSFRPSARLSVCLSVSVHRKIDQSHLEFFSTVLTCFVYSLSSREICNGESVYSETLSNLYNICPKRTL